MEITNGTITQSLSLMNNCLFHCAAQGAPNKLVQETMPFLFRILKETQDWSADYVIAMVEKYHGSEQNTPFIKNGYEYYSAYMNKKGIKWD